MLLTRFLSLISLWITLSHASPHVANTTRLHGRVQKGFEGGHATVALHGFWFDRITPSSAPHPNTYQTSYPASLML